ncbi:hypothetical protein [Adhaeribacter aerolatus]|nr:hypothetical protein [Adhaeribacter aerolatus]
MEQNIQMKVKSDSTIVDKIALDSPLGAPFKFTVVIGEATEGYINNHTFEVTGPDPANQSPKDLPVQIIGQGTPGLPRFFRKIIHRLWLAPTPKPPGRKLKTHF